MIPDNSALEWFRVNSLELIDFISKTSIKGEIEKNIKDRLLMKLQSAEKFIQSHKDPFYKEVTYLFYWSCLNEIIHQNFSVTRTNFIDVYFRGKDNSQKTIVKNSESYYYYVKAKPKNELAGKYGNIYRLKKDKQFLKRQDYLTHPSFLISIYLNLISTPNYMKQYMFSYLSFKRNRLSLIHDDEKVIATRQFNDTVNISDCIKMFKAIFYLLSNSKTTEIEDISNNKRAGNITGITLGTIISISRGSVKLKNNNNTELEYTINDTYLNSFSVNDYVELDFEKENDRYINKVKDIILLF